MLNFRKSVLLCLIFLLCTVSAEAATWRVEKDGSGDFTVIQHAVDAAIDGDTILIGPGRFDDFEPYNSGHWIEDIVVVIRYKNNLTLIGSTDGETIIGPKEYYDPYGENPQVIMGSHSSNIKFENLKVENCDFGIIWNSGSLSVSNCTVSHCYRGIYSLTPDGTHVENSEFFQQGGWSIGTNGECQDITIVDSSFHGYGIGIGFNNTLNALVTSCTFEDLWTAVQYSQASSGIVTSCIGSNVENSIYITTGSQVQLVDNFLEATIFSSLWVESGSYVFGTGNIFSGGSMELGTLFFSSQSTSGLFDNHILKGEGPAVTLNYYFYEHVEVDLSNNYWGTTDIETIEDWIFDGNDDSSIHGTVTFLPLADGPVSTESATLDKVKAMYR